MTNCFVANLWQNIHIRVYILIPGPSFYVSGEENDFKKETVVVSTNINTLLHY